MSDYQHFFMTKTFSIAISTAFDNTEIAAVNVVDFLQKHLDNGLVPAAVLIDVSKAFDAIDHKIPF